jgi:hypothetical protein
MRHPSLEWLIVLCLTATLAGGIFDAIKPITLTVSITFGA